MSNNFYPFNNRRYFQKLGYSFDKNLTNNISKNRIESAKTNFTTSNFFNLNRKDNNNPLFNDKPINNSKSLSIKTNKRPIWKYSYYIDKNDILSINNDPEIKNLLNEYKDIDKRPQKIEYSWSKPRMIKIIENNKMIEEEIKSNYWKYSYIFENNLPKTPGKLLKLMVNQLTSGYGGEISYISINKNKGKNSNNFGNKLFNEQHWRHPGVYKNNKNEFEPIKIKKPK